MNRLILPERVVAWVFENLSPEAYLLKSAPPPQFACGSRFHKHVVVVEVARPPLDVICPGSFLIVDVTHALLAKNAIVKTVLPPPALHHRIHRHPHFEGRGRVD